MAIANLKLKAQATVNPKAKTRRKQMTDVEKGMIIAFFYCFGSIQAVANLIARPWSTVKSFLARTALRLGGEDFGPILEFDISCSRVQTRANSCYKIRKIFPAPVDQDY